MWILMTNMEISGSNENSWIIAIDIVTTNRISIVLAIRYIQLKVSTVFSDHSIFIYPTTTVMYSIHQVYNRNQWSPSSKLVIRSIFAIVSKHFQWHAIVWDKIDDILKMICQWDNCRLWLRSKVSYKSCLSREWKKMDRVTNVNLTCWFSPILHKL